MVRRFWKKNFDPQFLPIRDEKNSIPHLRNTVESRIDQAVTRAVADSIKRFHYFLDNVVSTVMENVRHILHH